MSDLFDKRIGFTHDRIQGREEWLTPKWILDELGEFELDPCASEVRPWDCAKENFTIHDNGILKPWGDKRVWLNPPYGNQTEKWMKKMATHSGGGYRLDFRSHRNQNIFSLDLELCAQLFIHQTPGLIRGQVWERVRQCGCSLYANCLFRRRRLLPIKRHNSLLPWKIGRNSRALFDE